MTKAEALARFSGGFAEELHRLKIAALEDRIEQTYETIQQGIVEAFRRLFIKISRAGKETGFITVSLLRTSLKQRKFDCLFSAYDSNWYLDQHPVEDYYDAGWLFAFLDEFEAALNLERKKYVGKITREDTEKIKWDKLDIYKGCLILMFRKAIEQAVSLAEYQEIKRAAVLDIRVGEYCDLTESIWVEDDTGTPADKIKTLFEKKYENQTTYRHYKDIDIAGGDYVGVNFMYSRFERVQLTGSSMAGCILFGAKFIGCDLARADLRGSNLWFGDFSNSDLQAANLSYANQGVEAAADKLDKKAFIRIGFRAADLRGADLSHGNFSGGDFRGAELSGCVMTGARLTKALIDEKYADDPSLALTDEQRGEINWVK